MSGELPALLAQIDAKRALLAQRRPLSMGEAARLREYLDVEWTYHTNSIEGSTLTRQETLIVLKHGLTIGGKTLVEHLEATNHNTPSTTSSTWRRGQHRPPRPIF